MKMHLLSIIFWIVVIFILWHCFIIGKIIPLYYNTWRSRYYYEKSLWNKVKENQCFINVLEVFYLFLMFEFIYSFKIFFFIFFYKKIFKLNNLIFLNIKNFYLELNKMVFSFKGSNDSVYAWQLCSLGSDFVELNYVNGKEVNVMYRKEAYKYNMKICSEILKKMLFKVEDNDLEEIYNKIEKL